MAGTHVSRTALLRATVVALGLAGATFARSVGAEKEGFGYELRALAALNPAGVRVDGDALYRRSFYRAEAPLLALNGWAVRAGVGASPAALNPFASVSAQPLSILELSASYEADGYFGTLGFARSYPSPAADFGRDVVSSPASGPGGSTGAYALWVQKVTVGAAAQARVGRLLVRSAWAFSRTEAEPRVGDRVVYDPGLDTLVYAHGWAIRSDSDVGYALANDPDAAVFVGLRFTYVEPLYPAAAYAPGEPEENPNGPSMRLGPWVRWPLLRPGSGRAVDAVYLTTIAQLYLADRFHTGGTSPAAMPSLGLVLVATGPI